MKSFALISLLLATNVFAFNGRKCDTLIGRKGGFYYLPLSTAQFTSSTGSCSAIGKTAEQERQLFYAVNLRFIQNDIAKGNGESLTSLFRLSGCKKSSNLPLQKKLKESFDEIYSKDVENSYRYISPILDNYCKKSV